jgi:hypothetical protein
MASRPMFKQQDSFGPTADAYELHSYRDQASPSIRNGINSDAPVLAEDERKRKGQTVNDLNDMDRLGKTQELRVRFRARINSSEHN